MKRQTRGLANKGFQLGRILDAWELHKHPIPPLPNDGGFRRAELVDAAAMVFSYGLGHTRQRGLRAVTRKGSASISRLSYP